MVKVPEKYLHVHAIFRRLRSELDKLGCKYNVEDCLIGSNSVLLLRAVIAPITRHLLLEYGLTDSSSDVKCVGIAYKYCRAELDLIPILTVEQFLQNNAFAIKKLEFFTIFCSKMAKLAKTSCPVLANVLAKTCDTRAPISATSRSSTGPPTHILAQLCKSIDSLNERITDVFNNIQTNLANVNARMSVLEGHSKLVNALSEQPLKQQGSSHTKTLPYFKT